MIKKPFREHHLLNLLNGYSTQKLPLDLYISRYFREHSSLGSKDRGYIADTIYGMVRWQALIDYIGKATDNWEKRLEVYKNFDPLSYLKDLSIPIHIRVSFPSELFDDIINSYGESKAIELCLASNMPAPTTVRVNTFKSTREELFQKWKDHYQISLCKTAPNGILFHQKIHFFSLPEFKEGLFEIQDEGSQLLSDLVAVEPGHHVLDYCAGSGGKSLAFAPQMKGKGQIYLHDIRGFMLDEAKKRFRRAGIQNVQFVLPESPHLKKLKGRLDWVLVDAPCTGTGTLRRNPEMKWRYQKEMLERLIKEQRAIFENALVYLKPSGKIVYGTCSLLKEENQEQAAFFIKNYGLKLVGEPFISLPLEGGMDGFFGAVFEN